MDINHTQILLIRHWALQPLKMEGHMIIPWRQYLFLESEIPMVESKSVIALHEGIPGNSHNFIGMGQILTATGITPQILAVIGMGRGGCNPLI